MPRAEFTWDKKRKLWCKNVRKSDGTYTKLRAPTKPELRERIRAFENERDAGVVQAGRYTVRDIADRWRPHALAGKAYKTREAIENALDTHILPRLGDMELKAVKPADVDDLMLTLDGKSFSLRSKVLVTTRRIMRYAMENGYIVKDPTEGKKPGGEPADEVEPLTDEQCKTLLSALRGARAYVFVALGLYAGLRREEILGLAWDDVHLDKQPEYLEVTHAVEFRGNTPVRTPNLKSKAARRTIPLPSPLVDILKAAKSNAAGEYVVSKADGGLCTRQSFVAIMKSINNRKIERRDAPSSHQQCPKVLDFNVHAHQLRHTYITNLCIKSAELGLDIKTIQYLAGHSSPTLTLKIYSHVQQNERRTDISSKIQKAFSQAFQTNLQTN